jgi:hypothetical protein
MTDLPLSDAPQRPDDAIKVLLDGEDDVYDAGYLRWRYSDGKLEKVIEYTPTDPRRILKVWSDRRD